jgi:hypothetical protein
MSIEAAANFALAPASLHHFGRDDAEIEGRGCGELDQVGRGHKCHVELVAGGLLEAWRELLQAHRHRSSGQYFELAGLRSGRRRDRHRQAKHCGGE